MGYPHLASKPFLGDKKGALSFTQGTSCQLPNISTKLYPDEELERQAS